MLEKIIIQGYMSSISPSAFRELDIAGGLANRGWIRCAASILRFYYEIW